jgi:predicted ATPase with chaperone activity
LLQRAEGARDLKNLCVTEPAAEQLLERAMAKLGLSACAYTRILKVARTIADQADSLIFRASACLPAPACHACHGRQ